MNDSAQPPSRRCYPSDLTDAQWRNIAPLIPPERKRGRRRRTDMREIVNAINYRWTTGCVWRMLPHDFPPWETVYTYFRQWQRDGTLIRLREILLRRRSSLKNSPNAAPDSHQGALFPANDAEELPENRSYSAPRLPAAETATSVRTAQLAGHGGFRAQRRT